MLKTASILLFAFQISQVVCFTCPTAPIAATTLGGNLPVGATNITLVPSGTNCIFTFDIPNNYALLLKFSVDFQSNDDTVQLVDNRKVTRNLTHTGSILYDAPIWVSPRSSQVIVRGVSGNTRFMLSYMFQAVNDYKQVKKRTGEHFALNDIDSKTYYTITASSDTEKVVVNHALRAGTAEDTKLQDYFVYDGDNINTANMIGTLADFGSKIIPSTSNSITIVNFYGTRSPSYALGNDASTLNGFSSYTVSVTSLGSSINDKFRDLSDNGGLYTIICSDCSIFYWTKIDFDSFGTFNTGYITFQGQTPTHNREKLIKYDSMTFMDNQLPQMLPTNIVTVKVYLSTIAYNLNTINDDTVWKKPYDGRKGLIFSPSLWSSAANNFNYEFRDDSHLYNFTLNMNKMSFPTSNDQMTLKIGSGTGTPAVNNQYPHDKSSNGIVMSNGNYMQVGLAASVGADVRLSFEMRKVNSSNLIGTLTSIVLVVIYIF
ncbi:hypothetical protein GCK72_018643 [Caenorhabditis remanei]|uniref:CUB-like domain-containing protein n=1 Tax=Caenorhabditis remanei TaxID=31234 RepID=A0A6A5GCG8_CAERE|nr:hypothetical protein GCK72_018643 [Caenorhabditis remanei]KAF1752089.1 hypothetical protein GCK72_018643 [Caenorhabditis remanei]